MRPAALLFLLGAWAFVLGLNAWCFWRLLRGGSRDGSSRDA
jgi:hypothetical protein